MSLCKRFLAISCLSILSVLNISCSSGLIPHNETWNHGQGGDDEFSSKIDNIVEDLIDYSGADTSKSQNMVVGYIKDGQPHLLTYGKDHRGKEPTSESVYPLSSVTKIFPGILAAQGVVRGDFRRQDSVSNLLSDDLGKDVESGISIGMLAAHYSGLPNMPANLTVRLTVQAVGFRGFNLVDVSQRPVLEPLHLETTTSILILELVYYLSH